jgi:hypothetical protein
MGVLRHSVEIWRKKYDISCARFQQAFLLEAEFNTNVNVEFDRSWLGRAPNLMEPCFICIHVYISIREGARVIAFLRRGVLSIPSGLR